MRDGKSRPGERTTTSSAHTARWDTCRRSSLPERPWRCEREELFYRDEAGQEGLRRRPPCPAPHPPLACQHWEAGFILEKLLRRLVHTTGAGHLDGVAR